MELRQLRYVLAVARERSFTRAARRLRVSQSAISEQVAKLEAEIGFALFAREGRGIALTDANFDRLEAWEQVAEQAGITMTQLAIGWITAQPVVSTVIIGATSPEQVRENAAIGDMNLSADVLAAIAEADKAGNA